MNCKNCGSQIDDNFCAHCGQSAKVTRLNLQSFLSEIIDSVFQINKGLLYTIKELSLRPGTTISNFLEGKRKNYFKPIAYVFLLSTIYYLISKISDNPTLVDDFLDGATDGVHDKNEMVQLPILEWLSNNYAYTNLLLVPIFSMATYLSFGGYKRNYLEHIVLNAYITGHQAIIYSLFALCSSLSDHNGITVLFALSLSIVYNFWTYLQFFNGKNKALIIIRMIGSYLLYMIIFSIFLSLAIFPFLELKPG